MRQYNVGDTIIVDVELRDESGIQFAEMIFLLETNRGKRITLTSQAPSESGLVSLSHTVLSQNAPGIYRLAFFNATDKKGNRADYPLSSEWDFEVINEPIDVTGPELVSVTVR